MKKIVIFSFISINIFCSLNQVEFWENKLNNQLDRKSNRRIKYKTQSNNITENLPLHFAVYLNSPKAVKNILKSGININQKCKSGKTALHWAAEYGLSDMVNLLVAHGANINVKDTKGRTPLYIATQHNQISAIKTLISLNGNVNISNKAKFSPLHIATWANNLPATLILVNNNADVLAQNKLGDTPIHNALSRENIGILNLLISSETYQNRNFDLEGAINKSDKKKTSILKFIESKKIAALSKELYMDHNIPKELINIVVGYSKSK